MIAYTLAMLAAGVILGAVLLVAMRPRKKERYMICPPGAPIYDEVRRQRNRSNP